MNSSSIDSERRISIPTEILAALSLKTGDTVDFFLTDGRRCHLFPRSRNVSDLKGLFVASRSLSIEQITEVVDSEVVRKFDPSA